MIQQFVVPPLVGSNNLKYFSFFAVWHKSLTSLWRNFRSPFFPVLLQFIEVCRHLFMHISPSLFVFCVSHSEDFLQCFQSLSCCLTQFQVSYSCQTDGLTFDSRILWQQRSSQWLNNCKVSRSFGCKKAQIIVLTPPCFTVGMKSLCRYTVFVFLQIWYCALWHCSRSLVQHISCAATFLFFYFFWERRRNAWQPFQISQTAFSNCQYNTKTEL